MADDSQTDSPDHGTVPANESCKRGIVRIVPLFEKAIEELAIGQMILLPQQHGLAQVLQDFGNGAAWHIASLGTTSLLSYYSLAHAHFVGFFSRNSLSRRLECHRAMLAASGFIGRSRPTPFHGNRQRPTPY
jgi:hypothetical protein